MISPSDIKTKAERKYISILQSKIEGVQFTRLDIRGDMTYTKNSLSEFEKEITSIISQSKEKKGFGYSIDFQKVKTKYLGNQDLPISIYFDTETDLLKYLGKEKEAENFYSDSQIIIAIFPSLKDWIIQNQVKVIQNHSNWESILKVCQYFEQNPKPNLYIRELPITVHTKFVEKNKAILHELLNVIISTENIKIEYTAVKEFERRFNLKYAEPQVRFKVLENEISQKYFSGVDDIAIPISQFEALVLPIKKVLVIENKTTLYATLTLPKMKDTIAIFGSGYGVYNLKNVEWLKNIELLYWGDIDVQGFEILSQFRGYFPHTKSVLMDIDTFEKFFENDSGTPTNVTVQLNLTDEERNLYDRLKLNNWRLEQEKIPVESVNQFFEGDSHASLSSTLASRGKSPV